jgi:hypothetical protein
MRVLRGGVAARADPAGSAGGVTVQTQIVSRSAQIEELAALIGQAALWKLCAAFGGTKLYIPMKIPANHAIAETIGVKVAAIMAEHFWGITIDLPKAHLRRQRVLELVRSGSMTVAEAARACDYTERRVYQLLAAEREDDPQLDLFS